MSLSRFLAAIFDARARELREYDRAMRRYLARMPAAISRPTGRYPSRDEMHDRRGLR